MIIITAMQIKKKGKFFNNQDKTSLFHYNHSYDDYGYIDEYVEGILDRLIDDLEVSCEEE